MVLFEEEFSLAQIKVDDVGQKVGVGLGLVPQLVNDSRPSQPEIV